MLILYIIKQLTFNKILMKLRITLVCMLFLHAKYAFVQDSHFSNVIAGLTYLNPSYISVVQNPQINAIYRNQWPALNSAYVTYNASYIQPAAKLNSTFGIQLMHDNQAQGAILKTSLAGVYSYTVRISETVKLGAGLRLAYIFRNMNVNRLIFETDLTGASTAGEPFGGENLNSGYGDFSIGLTMNYDNRYFSGMSVDHITQPAEYEGEPELVTLSRRYTVHMNGKFSIIERHKDDDVFLKPGILFQIQKNQNEIFYGANCSVNPFEFGLWARQDLKFNYDAIVLLAGFSWLGYNFYYTYDVNMKNIQFFSAGMGAHEVTFLYNFQYKEKGRKKGAVKCPRF